MSTLLLGKQLDSDEGFSIITDALVEGGLLLTASSGNGKSYMLRKALEKTYGHIQQIVIDPEGEFASLRELPGSDYILAGNEGSSDIRITAKGEFPALLAMRVLELNLNIIIDIYELEHREKREFVAKFLRALVDSPKNLWGRKCIVVIDEAHQICPQIQKKSDKTAASEAVIALAEKGRKRGLRLVAATQRLAKLSKDATSELKNQLVGGLNNSEDRKRACEELGIAKTESDKFRKLESGEFFAVGTAFGVKDAIRVRADPVVTSHLKTGEKAVKYSKPITEKVKETLAKLQDLPQEAEKQLKTKQDLEAEVVKLKTEIRRAQTPPSEEVLEGARKQGYEQGWRDCWTEWNRSPIVGLPAELDKVVKRLESVMDIKHSIEKIQSAIKERLPLTAPPRATVQKPMSRLIQKNPQPPTQRTLNVSDDVDTHLRSGAIKMLKAAAMFFPKPITRNRMAVIAGYEESGGTFGTYLSDLKKAGYVEGDAEITATDAGMSAVGNFTPLPTDPEELVRMWKQLFRKGAATMLQVIFDAHPSPLSREELGDNSGFAPSGGTFTTYLSELKRCGLVEESVDGLSLSKDMFQ